MSAPPPVTGREAIADVWQRPSPRLGLLRRLEVAAIAVVLVLLVGVPLLLTATPAAAGILVAVVLAAAVVTDLLLQRRVRSWGFCEREDDLLVCRGLLLRRLSLVPYGRMQFVDVRSGPLERALGLATVHLHTAAAASDARIPGLTGSEAERLRDQLSTLGGARAAGL